MKRPFLLRDLRWFHHDFALDLQGSLNSLTRATYLKLEQLEDRLCPSADALGALFDFSDLQLDPDSYSPDSIIVRFRSDVDPRHGWGAQTHQSILGGSEGESLLSWMPELQRVDLPDQVDVATALAVYRTSPFVLYAEPDYRVNVETTVPNDSRYGEMWGLENTGQTGGTADADIDASRAWDVHTGSGATIVAVIDTGVEYTHPDLAGNMWINSGEIAGDGIDNDGNGFVDDIHGWDFHNNDSDPMDDNGHGTHVAGTIGAVGNNSTGVTGINWDVQIMALKFLGADGSGSSSAAIEAIDYAVANGATISNNSWGGDPPSQAMFDAISSARDADHIFVTAAGNGNAFGIGIDNDAQPFYPGSYDLDNIITVAAIDDNGDLATFSNYGETSVDLAAPGVDVLSTTAGGSYGLSSGTSMATPHVAGVIALLRDLNPAWTYDQVLQQILDTVETTPELQGVTITGGRLNAAAALGNPEPPPPPPTPVNIPVLEDFQDNQAEAFVPQIGNWDATFGRYDVRPVADNDDLEGISTFNLADPLPADFEIQATVNADEGRVEVLGFVIRDHLTNGYLIFDYHSRTDYKFAGADMVQDRWVIGHRDSLGWHTDAFVGQTLDASTDYDLQLIIEGDQTVTLVGDGVTTVTHTFGDSLNDGQAGLGMRNATAHFDNVLLLDNTPATPVPLPFLEDFNDGTAENFQRQSGAGQVTNGRLELISFSGQDNVQTIAISDPLPSNLELQAVVNADDQGGGRVSNAFLIFDYQSPTDFKYAGAYIGGDKWAIGHRNATGWHPDVLLVTPINALTDYHLRVVIENNSQVTLYADGIPHVTHTFADSVTDGLVGVGTENSITRFDDVLVQAFAPPAATTLPFSEDFDDGVADFFNPRIGEWTVTADRYVATPTGDQNPISVLLLYNPLPTNLRFDATMQADAQTANLFSNALLIFDYQSPTDFKFAGGFFGADQWRIGHRTATGWVTDVFLDASIQELTDYNVRLEIEGDVTAILYVNGLPQISYTFGGSLTDGELGVATNKSIGRFDNVLVEQVATSPAPTPGSLPMVEDFDDGLADHFQSQLGIWDVAGGQYEVKPFVGNDGTSTLLLSEALPADFEIQAVINANDQGSGYVSNAFIIFDYQSPTDFKYAGAYVGGDKWAIGHRDATGWIADVVLVTPIDALTDYQLRVVIENDSQVTLYADGIPHVSHTFADSLSDGLVGLGTENSVTRFDDVVVQAFVPPATTALPLSEDFQDGVADFFDPRIGQWTVTANRYEAAPTGDQEPISVMLIDQPLPPDLRVDATIQADPQTASLFSNAILIFDYHSPTDFKFAGAYVGSDQWRIGHRTDAGWVVDTALDSPIQELTDYDVRLVIEGDATATLFVNGVPQISHTFGDSLTDGALAVGTDNAIARFDDILVQALTPAVPPTPGTLPISEDFEDGQADHFEKQLGIWEVVNGQYEVTPAIGQDGVSTLLLSDPLPADVEVEVTINANDTTANYLSNAFVVFDYQSPTDFKFAGAYVGGDNWAIGHRDASGWIVDAILNAPPIDALVDYDLRLVIEGSSEVSLYVDGAFQVGHTYSESVTDGQLGLGTQQAISRFDNVEVRQYSPPATATLPAQEDFQDGVADFFDVRIGTWNVTAGRYEVTPDVGSDGISTLRVSGALPGDLDFSATVNGNAGTVDYLSNAFLIFDYHGPTDFKFAGARLGADRWVIGHRTSTGWTLDAWIDTPVAELVDYNLRLVITNHTDATLYVDGVPQVNFSFSDAVTDGELGLGTQNAVARFDDVLVQQYTAPSGATLPYSETFDDGVADFFQIQSGNWTLNSGRFGVTPQVGEDGISTIQFSDPLSPNLDIRALINANAGESGYWSNAFIIFDYHSPTDFKFAGGYMGSNLWAMGHRVPGGWVNDVTVASTINALTDYNLRVVIQNGTLATLYVDGVGKVSFDYGQSLVDGEVGIGTRNAIARFDNVEVKPYLTGGSQALPPEPGPDADSGSGPKANNGRAPSRDSIIEMLSARLKSALDHVFEHASDHQKNGQFEERWAWLLSGEDSLDWSEHLFAHFGKSVFARQE